MFSNARHVLLQCNTQLRLLYLLYFSTENTATVQERGPHSSPEFMAGHVDTLLILTNKKSAHLNRAGCINYLSCSSKEVVQY